MKILIDGNNVMRATQGEYHPSYLSIIVRELSLRGCEWQIIADANIGYLIDKNATGQEKSEFANLREMAGPRFVMVPGGSRADEFLLLLANTDNASIITNDRYRNYAELYPWVRDASRLLKYMVVAGRILVPGLNMSLGIDQISGYEINHPPYQYVGSSDIPPIEEPYSPKSILSTESPTKSHVKGVYSSFRDYWVADRPVEPGSVEDIIDKISTNENGEVTPLRAAASVTIGVGKLAFDALRGLGIIRF